MTWVRCWHFRRPRINCSANQIYYVALRAFFNFTCRLWTLGVHFLDKARLTSAFAPVPSANLAERLTCSVSDQSKTGRRSGARGQCTSDGTVFLAAPEQTMCLPDPNLLFLLPSSSVLPGPGRALALLPLIAAARSGCAVLGISATVRISHFARDCSEVLSQARF